MTVMSGPSSPRQHWPLLMVPLLAAVLVLPLLLHGPSCGHDFGFHMQSWMEVAAQMRRGVLLPHWAYSPAFNAGEPRFVFYPPLSWLLGGVLWLLLPVNTVPTTFTWLALTLAGCGMYALAGRATSQGGALLAAALYLTNPYMLFTAFERTAFAELLAAAWMPWLLRGALAETPSVLGIALPLALLWLTNAPAAVMGTYTVVLVALVRLLKRTRGHSLRGTGLLGLDTQLCVSSLGGLALGLALAAFYLVPAAWERRYVQIAMAIIPNMRVEDNFLFGHTGNGPHDHVLHTASLVAVLLLALSSLALLAAAWRTRKAGSPRHEIPAQADETLSVLFALGLIVAALLVHATLPVWRLLPEMMFLQFPWRLLAVLGCVYATAAALALGRARVPVLLAVALPVTLVAVIGPFSLRPFREACEAHELPADRLALFAAHHGVGPTDEYTPGDADNDQLRWDDPAWWLADNPNAPGPGTVPNPAATIVNYDVPPPLEQTISGQAPTDLHLHLDRAQDLILNLRAYPAWLVTVNGQKKTPVGRDDGLIVVSLAAGDNHVQIRWRRLPDVWLGDAATLAAAGVAAWLGFRSRRIRA